CAIVVSVVIATISSIISGCTKKTRSGQAAMGMHSRRVQRAEDRPVGKLEDFGKKMEEASKKMEDAQKSGAQKKQMEAAMGALGTALSGGKGVEPLQLDQIKPFVPEKFAGLDKTNCRSERSGVAGFMIAKAEGIYGDASGKQVELEVVDTGGMAG